MAMPITINKPVLALESYSPRLSSFRRRGSLADFTLPIAWMFDPCRLQLFYGM